MDASVDHAAILTVDMRIQRQWRLLFDVMFIAEIVDHTNAKEY